MSQGQAIVYNYGAPPPLPPGWAEGRTPTGQPYWYNTTTGQSSWVYPVYQQSVQPVAAPPKKKQTKKKIPGTHWLFVLTFDGYEFYYDRETKTSVWEMPEDLKEPMELLKKQEEEEKENKKRALEEEQEQEVKRIKLEQEQRQKEKQEQERKAKEAAAEATELTEDDFMWQLQQMEQEQEEEQEEPIEEEQVPVEEEELVEKEEPVVEEEPEPVVTPEEPKKVQVLDEEITRRFYDLLKERNISPFSVYSMEYPKLMTDPRFEMVPPNKQKVLFNKYCNELSEKIKNEKKNKKKPEQEFQELLDQVTEKMYWDDFRRKYKNDPRFKAIPVTKEKEALFKDHVKQLGTNKKNPTEEYMELLSSTKEIRVGIRWRDAKRLLEKDPRYHAIESKTEREDLFRDYLDTLQ